jgi:4-hydroxybenzoate polyprenyltransferase
MTFERWNYLVGLLLAAGFAAYHFWAASSTDDTQKEARLRMNGWLAVCLAVLMLLLLVFDPETRYRR